MEGDVNCERPKEIIALAASGKVKWGRNYLESTERLRFFPRHA